VGRMGVLGLAQPDSSPLLFSFIHCHSTIPKNIQTLPLNPLHPLHQTQNTHAHSGSMFLFPCGRCLEFPKDPDASLQQLLLPSPSPPPPTPGVAAGGFGSVTPTAGGAASASGLRPSVGAQRGGSASIGGAVPPLLRYEVVVATSDVRGAGTDGAVWVLLEGTAGSSGWTRLEASTDNVRAHVLRGVWGVLRVWCVCGVCVCVFWVGFFWECVMVNVCVEGFGGGLLFVLLLALSHMCPDNPPPPHQFDRGCRDVFSLVAPDLGVLTEVGVRKDVAPPGSGDRGGSGGGGGGQDWHLHSIEVLHPGAWCVCGGVD